MNAKLGNGAKPLGKTLYWFSNDLRLADNPTFADACAGASQLLCLVVLDPGWLKPNRYGLKSMGENRYRFWYDSVSNLTRQLDRYGHRLQCIVGSPVNCIAAIIEQEQIDTLAQNEQVGWYEREQGKQLAQRYPKLNYLSRNGHRLLSAKALPFERGQLPDTFSQFRKRVEPLLKPDFINKGQQLGELPPTPKLNPSGVLAQSTDLPPPRAPNQATHYPNLVGGEDAAHRHLQSYFGSPFPRHYKEHRNQLTGWNHSTKLSAWLACGSLGPHRILSALYEYESHHGANESTNWIQFELLWREYFQWYALEHGTKLFHPRGIKNKNPITSYYPQRFTQWRQGSTPYPLVNACIKQLNQTGYLSNRGRQIVASCLVNELQLDWRYGAAYFEQQLIDYDVASNWGNWQYLAGVGCDPRGKRHFDLNKQASLYDPNGQFVRAWGGDKNTLPIDAVDASDWPLGD